MPSSEKKGENWNATISAAAFDLDLEHTLAHESIVSATSFSKDGSLVATASCRTTLVFNVKTGEKIGAFEDESVEEDVWIRSLAFSPDGEHLATGADDKLIRVYTVKGQTLLKTFQGHEGDVVSLAYSTNGDTLISASGDSSIRIWNASDESEVPKILKLPIASAASVSPTSLAVSKTHIVAGYLDRIVRVWDVESGKLLKRLDGHQEKVLSVALGPDGKTLFSSSQDGKVRRWDLSELVDGASDATVFGVDLKSPHEDAVLGVGISRDGAYVASAGRDRKVNLWDAKSKDSLLLLEGHKTSVMAIAFSPVEDRIVTAGGDKIARIWKYSTAPTA